MYLKRIVTHIMIGIVFVGAGFLCGYLIGNLLYTSGIEPTKEISLPQEIAVEPTYTPPGLYTPEPTIIPSTAPEGYFLIQSIGSSIYIYEVLDTDKTPVKTFDVDINMFPTVDKDLLKEGIEAYSIQEAYEIIENFTS